MPFPFNLIIPRACLFLQCHCFKSIMLSFYLLHLTHATPQLPPSPTERRCPLPAPVRAHAKRGGGFSRLKIGGGFARLKTLLLIHHEIRHDVYGCFLHFSHIIRWQSGFHHLSSYQP